MVLPNKTKKTFKMISALTAGIFLFNQIAWAGDLINAALEQQYKEQAQTFAPAYLQTQQAAAEALISQQQANEDYMASQTAVQTTSSDAGQGEEPVIELKGPRGGAENTVITTAAYQTATVQTASASDSAVLSITTVEGDIIRYKDGAIDSIEKKDGTVLRNIILDENNNLLGAEIIHPDGTMQIVANGKIATIIKPDGVIYNYNSDKLVESVVYPNSRVTAYSYIKDAQNNIVETILTDSDKESRYDANNRLKKAVKSDGTTIQYENGLLSSIEKPDGSAYTFIKKEIVGWDGTSELVVTLSQYKDKFGNLYDYQDGVFSGSDRDSDVQLEDGTLQIIRNGYLIRIKKSNDSVFSYDRDVSGDISGITLTLSDGTSLYYTPAGDIIKKVDSSGTSYYEYENGVIKDKILVSTQGIDYVREYDYEGNPIKLVVENPGNLYSTYLFDESGALSAMALDANLPTTTPFNIPKTDQLPAQGYMQSSGVITTDGTYLYVKRWGTVAGSSTFEKIGTGYNGTIAGKNYGALSTSSSSYAATYYSDGNIYNPV
ncbi:MAG: hypothetical protein Q8R14_04040, partial [Candidatus Omnitrophota bacterium]|nr:hypothetical protein [Candidatus Omnitrophota bacterium]